MAYYVRLYLADRELWLGADRVINPARRFAEALREVPCGRLLLVVQSQFPVRLYQEGTVFEPTDVDDSDCEEHYDYALLGGSNTMMYHIKAELASRLTGGKGQSRPYYR